MPLLLLLAGHAQAAYEPTCAVTAAIQPNPGGGEQVALIATVRYQGCGVVASVLRSAGGAPAETAWTADPAAPIEAADIYVDCACEPLGSSWGTGQKSCPNETCNKEQQCACSKTCTPIVDACPPSGSLHYVLADADGKTLAEASIDSTGSQCWIDAHTVVEAEPEESSGGGGCAAADPAAALPPALLLALALLLLLARVSSPSGGKGALLALLLIASCHRREKKEEKPLPVPQAVEHSVEGTPWEAVVTVQGDLLDLFESGGPTEEIMAAVRDFRKKNRDPFLKSCQAALDWYAQEPKLRLGTVNRATSSYAAIRKRIDEITVSWGPGDKQETGIILTEFGCK